ncbi:MAG: hypothetical protein CMJ84_14855 [Planctomycetes bacterium]|nr:hypothetical protein [Planctomycetota bacterium]
MLRPATFLVIALSTATGFAQYQGIAPTQRPKPVYIYLFSHTEDHINLDRSEERFERVLPMLEGLHASYPQYGPQACFQFYGADSETLSFGTIHDITTARDAGVLSLGYHGAHEPTYSNNPIALLNYPTATWSEIQVAMELHLNAHRHLYLGDINPLFHGALKKTRNVFGSMLAVSGLDEFDPAKAHAVDATEPEAILFGYSAHIPNPPPNYMDGIAAFSELLSPTPDHVRQMFWARHHLRVSATDGTGNFDSRGMDGVAHLEDTIATLDRSRTNLLKMSIAGKTIYALQSPTGYAYNHPDDPDLPPWLIRPQADIDANYQNIQEVLDWLVQSFFPANPGSRFVSVDALQSAFTSLNGQSLSRVELLDFAHDLLDGWGGATPAPPPAFVTSGERYLSLCDMTQCLVGMLAGYGGSLPASVPLGRAIGPLNAALPSLIPPQVAATDLLAAAAALDPALNSTAWAETPGYVVPSYLSVGSVQVNAAEFLYLCASLFVDLAEGGSPSTVQAPSCAMLDPLVEAAQDMVGDLRDKWPYLDWDLKPAILSGFPAQLAADAPPRAGATLTVSLTDDPGTHATLVAAAHRASLPLSDVGRPTLDPWGAQEFPILSLGESCTGSWRLEIPRDYRGPLHLQALCENGDGVELTPVLSLRVR